MNVIRKSLVFFLIVILSACNSDSIEFEEQNIITADSIRSEIDDETIVLIIEFAPHISESQKNEIRMWVAEDGTLIDWSPIEDSQKENWYIDIDYYCFTIINDPVSLKEDCKKLLYQCPKLEKIKHLEDDGNVVVDCKEITSFPQH